MNGQPLDFVMMPRTLTPDACAVFWSAALNTNHQNVVADWFSRGYAALVAYSDVATPVAWACEGKTGIHFVSQDRNECVEESHRDGSVVLPLAVARRSRQVRWIPPSASDPAPVDFRQCLYDLGRKLRDMALDEAQIADIGRELIHLSCICQTCHGKGEDGDESGSWACPQCAGRGAVNQA